MKFKHNLSFFRGITAMPGKFVPCGVVEVLPGDTFQHKLSSLIRVTPLVAPLMANVYADFFHFFIPNRIVWDDWEDFITGNDRELVVPVIERGDVDSAGNDLFEYLGCPPAPTGETYEVNAIPVYCYNKVWNEWIRDQDLTSAVSQSNTTVLNASWGKDYFTTARPWPQKGPEVTLPLGVSAPVVFESDISTAGGFAGPAITNVSGGASQGNATVDSGAEGGAILASGALAGPNNVRLTAGAQNIDLTSYTGGIADLTGATAASVIDLRRALALQRFGERMASFGSRYTDYLKSIGVRSADARLQRPELLSRGSQRISFSEVLQTSSADSGVVGEMSGHGIAGAGARPYQRYFTEHGYVMTFMVVRPEPVYSTILPRHFTNMVFTDYYQRELELIGKQAILNMELFPGQDAGANDRDAWGYQDRYYQNRHQPNQVSNDFRVGGILDYWTMARGFATRPLLNGGFVECVPTNRVYADTSADIHKLWVFINHRLIARRMVTHSTIGKIL